MYHSRVALARRGLHVNLPRRHIVERIDARCAADADIYKAKFRAHVCVRKKSVPWTANKRFCLPIMSPSSSPRFSPRMVSRVFPLCGDQRDQKRFVCKSRFTTVGPMSGRSAVTTGRDIRTMYQQTSSIKPNWLIHQKWRYSTYFLVPCATNLKDKQ